MTRDSGHGEKHWWQWAYWEGHLLEKRSDNQISRNRSHVLTLQFIRQVPQIYLLSGNTLLIFLVISQVSGSKDVGTQSSHTIPVSLGLLCPVVRLDDCLTSTTTSVYFSDTISYFYWYTTNAQCYSQHNCLLCARVLLSKIRRGGRHKEYKRNDNGMNKSGVKRGKERWKRRTE